MGRNGAGRGVLFDCETDAIISTNERPIPAGGDRAWAASFIRAKHDT
jgi:hypothetical protein